MINTTSKPTEPMEKITTKNGRWLPVIGITGLAGSGKTTAAGFFEEHDFKRLSFAAPLKEMLRVLTPCVDKQASPEELGGVSVREALQSLGTDWARKTLGDDVWVRNMTGRIRRHAIECPHLRGFVIDDVRFDNEARMVHELGGLVVEIRRDGLERMAHVSEAGLSEPIDFSFDNNSSPDDLGRRLISETAFSLFLRACG
jgi:hypothetical protein